MRDPVIKTDYTPEETARMLGIDADRVRAMIRAGELRAWNCARNPDIGRPRFRITLDAINELREARAVKPNAKLPRRPRRSGLTEYV